MHSEHDHDPEEHGDGLVRRLRPYSPPRRPMPISRRNFLRGTGVLMALPFLDSLPAWAAEPATAAASAVPPRPYPQRFAAIFVGNGINANHWWAKGAGEDMELSQTLAPLAPLRRKLNV